MSKQIIYANNIKLFENVLSCFNGSAEFVIENPWFPIAGIRQPTKSDFMKPVLDKVAGGTGCFLSYPKLLHLSPNKTFTQNFAIGWTTVDAHNKLKKEYRISAPPAQEKLKRSQKVMVKTTANDPDLADMNLIRFSWQLNIAQDFLLVAKILDIDLKRFNGLDDEKFYIQFVNDANAKLKSFKASKTIEPDSSYIRSFSSQTPPLVSKNARKDDIFIYDTADYQTPEFIPLMQAFYDCVITIKGKSPFTPKGIERVWANPNCYSVPSFRLAVYVKQNDEGEEVKQTLDTRLTFVAKVPPTDKEFNEKFPDSLCTTKQVSKAMKVKLTKDDMPELWGAKVYPPEDQTKHESARQLGCLFIVPKLNYSFHAKGSPSVEWRVDTFALSRVLVSQDDGIDDACDFLTDEPEPSQTGGDNSEETQNEAGDFMGNENEADPDAL